MILELENLSHSYGDERAVDGVSLTVDAGELVGLLGPSGCGKTTLVQAIAGHLRPRSGRVILRGADATGSPPEARQVGVVFQQSTLYPHMTVGHNVGYGLAANGVSKRERDSIVGEYLELVSLSDKRDAYPRQLSGGEQRRVEVARALAPEPDILLLDEPLAALDRSLRTELQAEIRRIQRETGVSTLFVTHDQEEAMALADRIVVMNNGTISGRGTPRELFESPPTPFVASFLGRSNELPATVIETDPLTIEIAETRIALPEKSGTFSTERTLTCHLRPDHLRISTNGDGTISGKITDIEDLGYRYDISVRIAGGKEIVVEHADDPPALGELVGVCVPEDRITLFATS